MSWVCEMCSTNNEDSNGECFVCGNKRPVFVREIPEEAKPVAPVAPVAAAAPDEKKPERKKPKRKKAERKSAERRKKAGVDGMRASSGTGRSRPRASSGAAATAERRTPPRTTTPSRTATPPRSRSAARVSLTLDKKTIAILCALGICYLAGQIAQYVSYGVNGKVMLLTEFIGASDDNFNVVLFLVLTSAIGLIATGIAALVCYLAFTRREYTPTWQRVVIYCAFMCLIPSIYSCPAIIYWIALLALREKDKASKTFSVTFIVFSVFAVFCLSQVSAFLNVDRNSPFTVDFDLNGGSGGTGSICLTPDEELPEIIAPEREGYAFAGYYDSPEDGIMYFSPSMECVVNPVKDRTGRLYAYWTANKYTVTFNKKGGTGGSDSVIATYGELLPEGLEPPEMGAGYQFRGYYYRDSSGKISGVYYDMKMCPRHVWNIAEDVTLEAAWEIKVVKIRVFPYELYQIDSEKSTRILVYDGSGSYSDLKITYVGEGVECTLSDGVLTVKKISSGAVGYVVVEVTDLITGLTVEEDIYYSTT